MLFFGSQHSLRRQLLIFLIVSIIALSGTSSIVAAWTAASQSRQVLVQHALQIADNLAQHSMLSLLTESKENAEDAVGQVLGFNDVEGVAIFTERLNPLHQAGSIHWRTAQLREWAAYDKPKVVLEDDEHWIITAPVLLRAAPSDYTEFNLESNKEQLLGYVMLNVSKYSLKTLTNNLFLYNLMIGLLFACALVWLQNMGILRLTRPLTRLSQIMNEARQSGAHTYAEVEGAKEVRHIAESYNAMMSALEEQEKALVRLNEGLESEVQIRTRELTHARDAALVAVRTQSEFLANISHELRTPLQAVMGYLELAIEELEDEGVEAQVADLEEALRASNRLLTQINSILDLAKCESGRMELSPQTLSLHELVMETEAVIRPLAAKNGNSFEVFLPQEQHKLALDKDKTQQILLNLLSNAFKFTEHGVVSLSCFVKDDSVYWSVSDTGIGIPEDQHDLIFDKFRQVDGSVKRKYSGTGLGLAISRHFAEMMGGTLTVSSEPGEGAVFVLRLPLTLPADSEAQEEHEHPLAQDSSTGQELS